MRRKVTAPVLAALIALMMLATASCGSSSKLHGDASADANGDRPGDGNLDRPGADAPSGFDVRGEFAPQPLLHENGQMCNRGTECQSGWCTDGVCCNESCKDACKSCVIIGSTGVCLSAEAGSDPRGECPNEGVASCGRDGTCDGAGACQRYPAGTICKQPTCVGSTLTVAGRCDGEGACLEPTRHACDPYACGQDGKCLGACADEKDCIAGRLCEAAACGKKPLGVSCDMAAECNSGFCEQGVCCTSECQGTCWSCALTGSAGVCSPVPAGGTDVLSRCFEGPVSMCGSDGKCDGRGSCRLYPAGTECAVASCVGPGQRMQKTCSGMGACLARPISSCGRYRCAGGSCFTACISAADCVAPNQCSDGSCVAPCAAQFSFENGTEQQWIANQFAATAFGPPINDGLVAFCGTRSLKAAANYGFDNSGELFVALPAVIDFTGKSITYYLFVDGPPLPSGTVASGTAMKGAQFFSGGASGNLTVGAWNKISYAPNTSVDRIGLRLTIPPGAMWKGNVYLDEVSW